MESSALSTRIHSQLFELMTDARLRSCLLLRPLLPASQCSVHLRIRQGYGLDCKPIEQEIKLDFPSDYPASPPSISLMPSSEAAVEIPQIISRCALVQPHNWNPRIRVREILVHLINSLDLFWNSFCNFGRNIQFTVQESETDRNSKEESHKEKNNHYSGVNGSIMPRYQASFLSRLEQVIQDLSKSPAKSPYLLCKKTVSKCQKNQLSVSQTLDELLKCQEFRTELQRQLENGMWIHKILKSSSGLLCKKELIKCSGELLGRVKGFSCVKREKGQGQLEAEDLDDLDQ